MEGDAPMPGAGHRIPVHIVRKKRDEDTPETERNEEMVEEQKRDQTPEETGTPATDPQASAPTTEELDQMRERWMRAAADLDNVRKRMTRQIETESARARDRVLEGFLPVVDNLERALASGDGSDANPWLEGMEAIRKQMLDVLNAFGVEPFESAGAPFDPNHHDAVAHLPREGAQPGTVIEEAQRGYRRRDNSVLRPAKVVVAA